MTVRGWWLVAAIGAVAVAPLLLIVALFEPEPDWLAIPLGLWTFAVMRSGNRLIDADVKREVWEDGKL